MDREPMSHATLEKLAKNPAYKMTEQEKVLLAKYRAKKFKNNPNFEKHSTNESEPTDGQSDSN